MRPMFVAFPKTESMYGLASQFMFGDDILVSPKLTSSYYVSTALPPTESWYNYNTEMLETRSGTISETYPVMDIPMWVRAGSILPILNHSRQLSLLRNIDSPICLQVFTNSSSSAQGTLVLDDGQTLNETLTEFKFTLYSFGTLTYYTETPTSYYSPGK